tara:strand:- start:5923 stop:8154 length:2232 start_codon:yes stop_codon:yes gene_type:complete
MNDALGEFKMKSSATRVGLTSLLAVCMLGGTGWVVYSKWIGADSSLTGANQTDSEIAGLVDPDAVISEQDIIPPTGDDFDRLSMATDAQPVSGGEDEFTLSIGEDSVSDASADTGDDEFVVGDAAEPTTSTASDADSFVIGDQAAVDQFVASDPADEFTIADDTAPVAPSFDGQEDTTDFQIGDDSVTPTVTEAETPEATTVDEDQFSVSDIPVDPGTNTLVEDQPPVNLADDVALDAPGQLSLTEEPDLSPLPLPEANVDTGSSFEVGSDVSALPELTAQPGSLQLEGQQTPTLTVEKVAPAEVQVNRSAVFTTRIKNTGKVSAHGIRVTDFVPKGARLESAHPEFVQASDGSIQWALGTLEPGDETTVSMKLVPVAEGEIGSVARVSFEALASVRTVSTRPQISITQTAPEKVLIGQSVLVNVTVSNPGSGDATGIVLEADIPAELSHVAGNELEYPVGTLRPGQQKQVALRLTAEAAGVVFNTLTVRGNGQMEDRSVQQIEVVAPDVQVGLRGPKVRYLDREATYAVDVANPGTASARNVNLVAFLSKGLKFVSTDHFGEYDAREHAVYWKLEELPPNVRDSVKLTAVAVEPGEQKIVLEGTADLDVKDSFNHIVRVESVPELEFSIKDTADPIEVGSDTTYEIRVVNRGTRTATGVQIYAAFPEALRAVQGGGPSDLRIEGQNAVFAPLDRLPPNKEAVFRVKAKALGIGDNVIKVQMLSDDVNVPVTKEESTRIYSDN